MHRRMVEHESWVPGQPCHYLLALVHSQAIQHPVHGCLLRRQLPVQLFQERDELHLPLPLGGRAVDFACSSVEGSEQLVFSSTHNTISQGNSSRVYRSQICCTEAAKAASRGT